MLRYQYRWKGKNTTSTVMSVRSKSLTVKKRELLLNEVDVHALHDVGAGFVLNDVALDDSA